MASDEPQEPVEGAEAPEAPEAPEGAPEGTAEAPPPEAEAKGARDYSRQFAALGRKSAAVKERETALADRERRLSLADKDRQELETFRQLRQQARRNPRAWLEAGAVDRDTAARAYAERGEPSHEVRELREQMAEMAKRLEAQDREGKQRQVESAKQSIFDNISRHVEAKAADYELLHAENRIGEVYDLMDQHYREHNEVLSVRDACQAMESALVEQRVEDAQRIRRYKSLAPRLGWQAPPEDQPAETPPQASKPKTKTTQSRRDLPATSPTVKQKKTVSDEEAWEILQRRFTGG